MLGAGEMCEVGPLPGQVVVVEESGATIKDVVENGENGEI